MKCHSILALLFLGGCAAHKPLPVAVAPTPSFTSTPVPKPTPRPKPKVASAPQDPGEIRAVEFSPDIRYLAVGTRRDRGNIDGVITIRDCTTNRIVKSWTLSGGVKFLAFSPDSKNLAVTGVARKLSVWKWRTGQRLHTETLAQSSGGDDRVSIAFSPDSRVLAIGVDGIQLRDTAKWKPQKLNLRSAEIDMMGYLRFSPDGRFLLAADNQEGYDGYAFIPFKGDRGRNIFRLGASSLPTFSKNGSFVAGRGYKFEQNSNGIEGTYATYIWNTRTLKMRQRFPERFEPQDFSPDNRFIVGVSVENYTGGPDEGPIEIWSVATGKCVRRFKEMARRIVWLNPGTLLLGDEKGVRRLVVGHLSKRGTPK